MKKQFILLTVGMWMLACIVNGQNVTIKTNLLYGGSTLTPNAGVEVRLADRWSLDLSGGYNPWTFGNGKQFKHWLVQPEARYWLRQTFGGHFLALHALGGSYNVNRVRVPWKFAADSRQYRYEGWAAGLGIGYGYAWHLGRSWNLEVEAGVGYVHLDYDRYPCKRCSALAESRGHNLFRPTKLALNLVYTIGRKRPIGALPLVAPAPAVTAAVRDSLPAENLTTPAAFVGQETPQPDAPAKALPAEPAAPRTVRDTLTFRFGAGQATLASALSENKEAFASLDSLVRQHIRIERITVIGHASPEGGEARNRQLAQARAEALKEYLRTRHPELLLPDSLFTVRSEGEDWEGISEALDNGDRIRQRDLMLGILREENPLLRKRQMLQHKSLFLPFYPALRRTVCIIEHTTK